MNLIQLVPGIRREEWLSFEDARHLLHTLHQAVSQEWVDLFALWEQYQGRSFTFADVCRLDHTEEQRLAWGLDLLTHGHELFQRDGSTWASLPEQRIAQNVGFVRHLTLLDAGKQAGVLVNGRQGTLTGRSSWRYFEVRWLDGDEVGECTKVRSQHLQLV